MEIQKTCNQCLKEFSVLAREVNRGGGKFCSRTCCCTYNRLNRKTLLLKCLNCSKEYQSLSKNSKFCTRYCSSKYRSGTKIKTLTRSTLSLRINKALNTGTNECLSCGWNLTTCDIHHIIPSSRGGTDSFNNLTILCPNCHRLVHKNKLNKLTPISERIGLYHNAVSALDAVGSP